LYGFLSVGYVSRQIKNCNKLKISTKDKYEFFMRTVYNAAQLSKDPKTRIGSVLVKDDDIVSIGYNNFPRKVLDLEERYNDRELKHLFVAHSEFNSIINAARKGASTLGCKLFTNGQPCHECMKAVINAGIDTVVVHKQWPQFIHSEKWIKSNEISNQMVVEAVIKIEVYDKELGMEGLLDGKVIKV
jgi:dCMP deaminase